MRVALLNKSTNVVDFVFMLDQPAVPDGMEASAYTAIANDSVNVGDTWNGAAFVAPPPPANPQVLPQDMMAQFTAADMVKITAAMNGDSSGQMSLLWYAMVAQRDPMVISNARFMSGWNTLVQVLGQARMNAIATALNKPSLVV